MQLAQSEMFMHILHSCVVDGMCSTPSCRKKAKNLNFVTCKIFRVVNCFNKVRCWWSFFYVKIFSNNDSEKVNYTNSNDTNNSNNNDTNNSNNNDTNNNYNDNSDNYDNLRIYSLNKVTETEIKLNSSETCNTITGYYSVQIPITGY